MTVSKYPKLPYEEIGVRGSHFRTHRCSINLSAVLSVESESVMCEECVLCEFIRS